MKRTLTLRRETLTALGDADLAAVVGAAADTLLTKCPGDLTRDSYVVCTGTCATRSGTCAC